MKLIMSSIALTSLINRGFRYVMNASVIYKIDESHALKHSMEVFRYAKNIYESEVVKHPYLKLQEPIIYAAAIGHDMCDRKYIDVNKGVEKYTRYMSSVLKPIELNMVEKIMTTMSYSKVKLCGYPNLGEYQLAYNIVREADLLAAYDIDRSIIYSMYIDGYNYTRSLEEALKLFDSRILKMRNDKLFITNYSNKESAKLHTKAENDIKLLKDFTM